MLGTWRWNIGFGLFGIVLTVVFSISSNPLSVILLRSVYAFIAFFILAYAVRAILAIILRPPAMMGEQPDSQEDKGTKLDLTTPDETDDINQMLKSQIQEGLDHGSGGKEEEAASAFQPLNPPQLVSKKNMQPEELTKAIRHLTGE